jgi:Flp pilus assembly protein TadG
MTPEAAKTGDRRRRRAKPSERGQVLVLFVLISLTVFLICVLSTAVGQMMVRRHYAQMVADAAAFAGGRSQAEGMNIIARYNQKSANLMSGIQASMQEPYFDSKGTTTTRILTVGLGGKDWAGTTLKNYQKIFDGIDRFIDITNLAYASTPFVPAFQAPPKAAKRVVDANFSNSGQSIFTAQDLESHGVVFDQTNGAYELVKLTNKKQYKLDSWLHGYTYLPNPGHFAVTCVPGPYCVNVPCCLAKLAMAAAYGAGAMIKYRTRWAWDPIKYRFGRYYDQKGSNDVRFTYYVEVKQTPVIFGRNFFADVPTIVAIATAKPYGGYLGTDLKKTWIGWWDEQSGKEASPTYKAKLVPVRWGAVVALGARLGGSGGLRRWNPMSVTH